MFTKSTIYLTLLSLATASMAVSLDKRGESSITLVQPKNTKIIKDGGESSVFTFKEDQNERQKQEFQWDIYYEHAPTVKLYHLTCFVEVENFSGAAQLKLSNMSHPPRLELVDREMDEMRNQVFISCPPKEDDCVVDNAEDCLYTPHFVENNLYEMNYPSTPGPKQTS